MLCLNYCFAFYFILHNAIIVSITLFLNIIYTWIRHYLHAYMYVPIK